MNERVTIEWRERTLLSILVLLLVTYGQLVQARPAQDQPSGQAATRTQSPAEKPAPSTAPEKTDDVKLAPPAGQETIDDLMKGYDRQAGLITLYRRLENGRLKLYAEIREEQLDQPFLLQAAFSTGSSRPEIPAGRPIRDLVLKFSRTSDGRVLLIAPDLWHRAKEGAQATMERDFPVSYLEIFEVAAKQEERRSLLIEISDLFQGAINWPDSRTQDSDSFDLSETLFDNYDLDSSKSFLLSAAGLPDHLTAVVQYHFRRRPQPPPPPADPNDPWADDDDSSSTDKGARSLPLKVIYHLRPLPDGYRPRLADPRVGYFVDGMSSANRSGFENFDDAQRDPRVLYINRWRLEKADPQAAVSPPKQTITFWVGKSVPVRYRAAVREGILMWNPAFERVGFKDAIVVRQMPDDADWDEADPRFNTVRWIKSPASENDVHAEAFVHENPLTGEILSSSINLSAKFVRLAQSQIRNTLPPARRGSKLRLNSSARCDYGEGLWFQGWFGLMSLELLGEADGQVNEDAYVHSLLREAVAHEMGHALGLRHNFIASTLLDAEALSDARTVARVGVSASVMDYAPFNIFALRHPGVDYYSSTIGPYDYWAIEYGYKPTGARTPEEEVPELRRIAARSGEPGLAYQSDELADLYDPSIVRYDLGRDPLVYWEEMLSQNQRLIQKLGGRKLAPYEDCGEFTRSLYALIQAHGDYARQVVRYVGGLRIRRDDWGNPKGLPQLVPLSAAEQQRALRVLNTFLFAEGEWVIPHEYFGRLAGDPFALEDVRAEMAFPVRDEVVRIRQMVLRALFSPERLSLIVNNEYKVTRPDETLTLQQLFTSVRRSVWKGLDQRTSVAGLQRELQRAHLDLLIALAEGSGLVPGDARLCARHELRELSAKITASRGGGQNAYTRLHLEESLARINSALGR